MQRRKRSEGRGAVVAFDDVGVVAERAQQRQGRRYAVDGELVDGALETRDARLRVGAQTMSLAIIES